MCKRDRCKVAHVLNSVLARGNLYNTVRLELRLFLLLVEFVELSNQKLLYTSIVNIGHVKLSRLLHSQVSCRACDFHIQ
jgi:hypothetical protein